MNLNLEEIKKFGKLSFLAQKTVNGFLSGLHKSPLKGFSVEFAEHKPYYTGNSTKHIDWKLFAKTDKLYNKLYEAETNLRAYIFLDNSSSMYFPENNYGKLTFSSYAAACLLHLFQKQRDSSTLILGNNQVEFFSESKNSSNHTHFLCSKLDENLATNSLNKSTNLGKILKELALKIPKRSIVVIFSDLFETSSQNKDFVDALQFLKYQKNEVIIFHVVDHNLELNFNFDAKPLHLIDIETGKETKVRPEEIKNEYQKFLNMKYNELQLICKQYQVDYIEVDCNKSIEQVLLAYLLKRSKKN